MLRGLPSWVAAVLLLVGTGTLPWTGGDGTPFSRTFEANGGSVVVWWASSPLDGAAVAFLLIAVGFVVQIPPPMVALLAIAGAVAWVAGADRGALGGGLLTFAALALGVVAAFVPRQTTRPRVVPVLAGVVLLVVALTPTAIALDLPQELLSDLLGLMVFDAWAATVLIAAAGVVALTPVLPGGRRRALVPLAAGATIVVAVVLAEDVALDDWTGLPVAAVALAAAAIALVRAPEAGPA